MKKILLAALILSVGGKILPQTWQPLGIPEGSGVTELVYFEGDAPFDDKVWVTTGSVNWPTGQRGGVFYSSGNGVWNRIGGSAGYYIGRTLAVGQDGNLYASLWRDPATFPADALCRFSVQAGIFGLLYQAQAGDNIFSIAVKNNPHTIFGGTRNGVIRSTDNGATFGYSNNGIPNNSWVFDLAIDSTGIIAAASSNGLFISTSNGDSWQQVTQIPPEDTIVSLLFYNEETEDGGNSVLMSGSKNGKLYTSTEDQFYLNAAIVYAFLDEEVADIVSLPLILLNRKRYGIGIMNLDPTSKDRILQPEGGFYLSTDNGLTWMQEENGLPPNPPVSALAVKVINETSGQFYAGLFNDTTNGAGVYRMDIIVDVDETNNQIPTEYKLEQNYPNPFNPSTTIQLSIPEQTFVNLEVFNSLGEKVITLVADELNAGNYKYEWNAEFLSSGIYFYTLRTKDFVQTQKMLLLK